MIDTSPMIEHRSETDLLGTRDVPADALWGIHTLRAMENFPLAHRPVHRRPGPRLWRGQAGRGADQSRAGPMGRSAKVAAIEAACQEMIAGRLDEHVIVDALQGGAGTSTNMNVNEVLANRALQLLGRPLGDYQTVNPHDDLNLHQSTNDTYPTALRVAAIFALHDLERKRGGAAARPFRARKSNWPTWSRSAAPNCRTPCWSPWGGKWPPTPRLSPAIAGESTSARSGCGW